MLQPITEHFRDSAASKIQALKTPARASQPCFLSLPPQGQSLNLLDRITKSSPESGTAFWQRLYNIRGSQDHALWTIVVASYVRVYHTDILTDLTCLLNRT